jgi:hypothetical protein
MKTAIIKQEILLMIKAFSKKELCARDASKSFHHQSCAEQLEEACWNGLLDELLSGIIEKAPAEKRPCIWRVQQGKSFIEIELCNAPEATDKCLSVDPYIFLPIMLQN